MNFTYNNFYMKFFKKKKMLIDGMYNVNSIGLNIELIELLS